VSGLLAAEEAKLPADLAELGAQNLAPPGVATEAGAVGREEENARRLTTPPTPIDAKWGRSKRGRPRLEGGKTSDLG
jgi:hypothetical protein